MPFRHRHATPIFRSQNDGWQHRGAGRLARRVLLLGAGGLVAAVVVFTVSARDTSKPQGVSIPALAAPAAPALREVPLALPRAETPPGLGQGTPMRLALPPAASPAPTPPLVAAPAAAQPATDTRPGAQDAPTQAPFAEAPAAQADTAPAALRWESMKVRSGDSLATIFRRAGLTARDVHDVVNAGEPARSLTRIFPGDSINLGLDDSGALQALRYEVNETDTLNVRRDAEGFRAAVDKRTLERRHQQAAAVIETSLYEAAKEAGLEEGMIMELAGIFGWDVDFALDIRQGDSFVVVYDEIYREGEHLRAGDILAAEFVNRGDVFRAVRYTDPEGRTDYFAPDGRSMRKAFLRTPINFARVSSNFNPQRFHPVLGVKRPHMGTDYAARPGTPIKAAGDGRIIHRGRKGGYGRTVILRHGERYTTLYAHMSRYKGGLGVGSRVRQGQVIGYVGASGLATGPHLHYEFRIDGVHRNPRTVKLPDAQPIDARFRADFLAHARQQVAELELISRTRLAMGGEQ